MEFRNTQTTEAPSFKRNTTNPFTQHVDALYQAGTGFVVDVENVSQGINQLRNATADKGLGCRTRVVTENGETHPTQKSDSTDPGYLWIQVTEKRAKAPQGSQNGNGKVTDSETNPEAEKATAKGTKGNK